MADDPRSPLSLAYEAVLNSDEGRRVLFDILERCGLYQSTFTGENNASNYKAGRRDVGLEVLGEIDALDPRHYPSLLLRIAELKAMDKAAEASTQENDDAEHDVE